MDAKERQPERLVFYYKSNIQKTWPLHRILEEDYKVIVFVYTKMDTSGRGFSGVARTILCNKISEIRRSWATTDGPPRKYTIPYSGKNVHLQPDWMMEFRDEEGVRRLFRMRDQAPKADNDTLRLDLCNLNSIQMMKKRQHS